MNYLVKAMRNYPSTPSPLLQSTLHSLLYLVRTHEAFQGDPSLQANVVSAIEKAHPMEAGSCTLFPVARGMVNLSDDAKMLQSSNLEDEEAVNIASSCLAGTLMEVGYAATYSKNITRAVFSASGIRTNEKKGAPLAEADVAKCLVRMGNTQSSGSIEQMPVSILRPFLQEGSNMGLELDDAAVHQNSWNLDVFIAVLNEDHSYINWNVVIRSLDLPDSYALGGHRDNIIRDSNCFHFIVNAFKNATGRQFPTREVLRPWRYARAQLAFLEHAVVAEPSTLTFADAGPLIAPVEGFAGGCGSANQCWCCVPLYTCLLRLAHIGGLEGPVVRLLEIGQMTCSQLVLLGLAHAKANSGVENAMEDSHPLRTRAYDSILTKYFRNLVIPLEAQNDGSTYFQSPRIDQRQLSLLHRLWGISPALTVNSLLRLAAAIGRNMTQQSRDRNGDSLKYSFACISKVVLLLQQYSFKDSTIYTIYAPAQPEMAIQCATAVFMKQRELDVVKPVNANTLPYETSLTPRLQDGKIMLSSRANPVIDQDGLVNFEGWIEEQLVDGKPMFSRAFLSFVKQTIKHYFICFNEESANSSELAIAVVVLTDICHVSYGCADYANTKVIDEVRALHDGACQRLQTLADVRKQRMRDLGKSLVKAITSRGELNSKDKIKALSVFKNSGRFQNEIFDSFTLKMIEECKDVEHTSEDKIVIRGEIMGLLVKDKLLRLNEAKLVLSSAVECLKSVHSSNSAKKFATMGLSILRSLEEELLQWPDLIRHLLQMEVLRELDPKFFGFLQNSVPSVSPSLPQSSTGPTRIKTSSSISHQGGENTQGAVPTAMTSEMSSEGEGDRRQVYKQRIQKFFDELGPALSSFLAAAVRGEQLPALRESKEGNANLASQHVESTNAALDVDKLIRPIHHISQAHSPPTAIADKLHFILNNLSESNMESKVPMAKELLKPEYFPWLANFLVSKRVATQPNFHGLYLKFLDHLDSQQLNHEVYLATLENIRRTLQSDVILSSTQERTVLKNMGSWLGKVTLARNRPILQRDADLKEMLFQAYETGRLIAVMPFIAKVLEAVVESPVFHWPNPWTTGLVAALREIYTVPDLKLNLKFEVEVLCRQLGVEAKDIPVKTDLQKRKRPILSGNADFNLKDTSNAPSIPGVQQKEAERLGEVSSNRTSNSSSSDINDKPLVPKIEEIVEVSSDDSTFASPLRGKIKRAIALSVEKSVLNLIEKVVGRSVTIACITTKELVCKDFAYESSISKLEAASQLMSSTLAGSLAGVTSFETLKTEINNNLKKILSAAGVNVDDTNTSKVTLQLAADNVELGRMLLEKATMEYASREIENHLHEPISRRQQYLDQVKAGQTQQQFIDTPALSAPSRWLTSLPEVLRPVTKGLDRKQLKVYEAFSQVQSFEGQLSQGNLEALETAARDAPQATDLVPPTNKENESKPTSQGGPNVRDMYLAVFERLKEMVGQVVKSDSAIQLTSLPANHPILRTIDEMGEVAKQANKSDSEASTLTFARAVFLQMFQPVRHPVYLEIYLAVLSSLRRASQSLPMYVNQWYHALSLDQKLNRETVVGLIRYSLLPVKDLDSHLVTLIEQGMGVNIHGVAFACMLVHRCIVAEQLISPGDLQKTMSVLVNLARRRPCPLPTLPAVVEAARKVQMGESIPADLKAISAKVLEVGQATAHTSSASGSSATPIDVESRSVTSAPNTQPASASSSTQKSSATNAASSVTGANDPENVRRQVLSILEAWVRLTADSSTGSADESHYQKFLQLLEDQKVLSSDTDRFFRIMMELCVQSCNATCHPYRSDARPETSTSTRPRSRLQFTGVDAMSKFIVLLVRIADDVTSRLTTLSRISSVVVKTLFNDAESNAVNASGQPGSFDQRPYLRLFCNLMTDMHLREGDPVKMRNASSSAQPDPQSLHFNAAVLSVFANLFHAIRPEKLPSFAFSWLDLISHRMFMPKLLSLPGQQGWPLFHRLLLDLLHYMYPYLDKSRMSEGVRLLYRGTMRLFLVLLHDFAEFLCDYHLSLCIAIPPSCVQLRNLVLSAFPGSMRLPDPFTPNLKIDRLPEIRQPPRILLDPSKELGQLSQQVDEYLPPNSSGSLAALKETVMNLCQGSSYACSRIFNSLVLYVGMKAIRSGDSEGSTSQHMEIFKYLVNELEPAYRYAFLNAIANQLRYPNSHTHYFSSTLLRLFLEAKTMNVKEQITRVLLERLVAHRPHPWGLLITFIELVMNSRFDFWSHPFTRCAPQIERLFESVAKSCIGGSNNTAASSTGSSAPSSNRMSQSVP